MSFPAGWYDDGSGKQRWWDGTGWTEQLQADELAEPAAPDAPAAPAEPSTAASPASAVEQSAEPPVPATPGYVPPTTQPPAGYGAPTYQGQPYGAGYQPLPTNGLAITALILGILGFGVVAVIFGHIALAQIQRNPQQQGRGMAIAGLILGYIVLAFWVIFFGFVLIAALLSIAS